MLTQCLQCAAVYRVKAGELAVAHGFVTCGNCGQVFNALNRLLDEPVSPTASAFAAAPVAIAPEESRASSPIEPVNKKPPASAHEEEDFDTRAVPEILRADLSRLERQQRNGGGWWTLLALLAFLVLLAQGMQQYHALITARVPEVAPLITKLCATLTCAPTVARAMHVAVVARDIREHPTYKDALLVNATIVNRGDAVIPYPTLQLSMYRRQGDLLGVRRFAPTEYLDASIDITQGMAANRLVYVVIEIANLGVHADSYEFSFL